MARNGEQVLDFLFRQGGLARTAVQFPAELLVEIEMLKIDGIEVRAT